MSDLWEEFIVRVPMPHLNGMAVPMCGLCGGTGTVNTTGGSTKTPLGQPCGVIAPCICPNGRAQKERAATSCHAAYFDFCDCQACLKK